MAKRLGNLLGRETSGGSPMGSLQGKADGDAWMARQIQGAARMETWRRERGEEKHACGCLCYEPNDGRYVAAHDCCGCWDLGYVLQGGRFVVCPSCAGVDARLERFRLQARIDRLYAGASFSCFDPKPDRVALSAAIGFVKEWPPAKPFLLLASRNMGNGKTTLAVSIQYGAFKKFGVLSEFWAAGELIDAYRAASAEKSEAHPDQLDAHFAALPLLVLDDLGTEYKTEFATERLYSLVDRRYKGLKPTVITTNVSQDELGSRMVSRMRDVHVATVVVLNGPDRRAAA